jgi:hypothetical protein
MWPFSKRVNSADLIENPRYREKPVLLLFEIFILDVIGRLSAEKRKSVQELDIKKIFKTRAAHWKPALREVLQLSNTIETAILNAWVDILSTGDTAHDPETFSRDLSDAYFKASSTIDVWADGELEKAKERIEEYRKKGLLSVQTA